MPIYPGTTLTAKFLGAAVTAGPVFAPAGTELTPIVYVSGTMTIDYSLSAKELVQSGAATWVSGGFGTFTSTSSAIKVYGDCWIRMRCTAGEVWLSVNPSGNTIPMRSDPTTEGAGGGGGATTFAALTDKATADIPAINTPLATALAAKASTASLGSAAFTSSTDYATAAQGSTADAALRPGSQMNQSAINAATAAGAGLLSQLVYIGDFSSAPATASAGNLALFTGTIDGRYWSGLFIWSASASAWRPVSPVTVMSFCAQSGATGVNTVTTEQWLKSVQLPAKMLMCCGRFAIDGFFAKSGVVTTASVQTRLGATQSASDAQISGTYSIAAASRNAYMRSEFCVDTTTSIIGAGHPYGAVTSSTSVAAPRVLTVSDLTQTTYVQWTATLGATGSDVPSLVSGSVVLLP